MHQSPELQVISNILSMSLELKCSPYEGDVVSHYGKIDWNRFISLVYHHRVGGLLYYWIRNLELESSLPRRVWRGVCDISKSISAVWDSHRRILKGVLMQFKERGIDVILLKGAQLGHTDYPHFSLRPIEDIDLLVRESDRSETIKLMLERGFSLYGTNQTCDKFFMSRCSKERKEEGRKPVFVELHSNLQTPIRLNRAFSIDMGELWNRAQGKALDGLPFFQLSTLDNLLYLSAHFGHHYFSRLIWAYDIALHIQLHRKKIHWEKLEDISGSMRIRNALYHSLSLCREMFQLSIPGKVLKNLSPSWGRRKIGYSLIRGNLLYPEQSLVSRFKQFLLKVFLVDSWMEAIQWFLFPTKEWIKQRYSLQNTQEIYTYYLLHPILYLIKGIRASWRI